MNPITVACAIAVVLVVGALIFEIGHARGYRAGILTAVRAQQQTTDRMRLL